MTEDTRALGAAAALGFAVLVVLLVALVISEENIVGTAAGLVAIVTGVLLGLYLWRGEREASEPEAAGSAGPHEGEAPRHGPSSGRADDPAADASV